VANRLRPWIASAMFALLPALFASGACADAAGDPESFRVARERLISSIRSYARPIGERPDHRILAAMQQVPRHLFVPPSQRHEAYQDYPLPIGEDQTISQPSLVALMTHLLRPNPGDVVLEVGTGSGYQAAILSRLVGQVYSIEIVKPLAEESGQRLDELGYSNVEVRHGDGYLGWPEHAPFDGIIVTAGAEHVPQPLIDQLKPGGFMVIPVGSRFGGQQLKLPRIDEDGCGNPLSSRCSSSRSRETSVNGGRSIARGLPDHGAECRTRTDDLPLTRRLLYQLS
jgi:protein-L-isoaspartate(D-aspartate) O-methyltransferase